jgi:hypothetical protein
LPALGHEVEIFEDDNRRRQHLREVIDRPNALDRLDDEDGGFAGNVVDEALHRRRFSVAWGTG